MVKDECYDVELYDWTKVDITNEEQKALVNAYFEEPDEIEGVKLLEAKCFKWSTLLLCNWSLVLSAGMHSVDEIGLKLSKVGLGWGRVILGLSITGYGTSYLK